MPGSARPSTAPGDLARRIIGLLNLYRLLIPPTLLAIGWITAPQPTVGAQHPRLFLAGCILYFAAGVIFVLGQRFRAPGLRQVAIIHGVVDALAIALLLFASGGVDSGLGILLVLPVGAAALLAPSRVALFVAATASVAVLAQQIFGQLAGSASAADYPAAGVLGAIIFLVALGAWPLANRLRESEALVKRQEIDLANLAQLSQYIVQHLRESILVVDPEDRIRLINESAAQMLGDEHAFPGALLGEASPRLLYLLTTWRQAATDGNGFGGTWLPRGEAATFVAADGARVIQPHFAPLGGSTPAPVLVFLEDVGMLAARVQQSKLAALGRLSASIAHEIRNPVGAMSHAAQLLAESPTLPAVDRKLVEIITRNAGRVSEIIQNVLSMSRRDANRPTRLQLAPWLEGFRDEFCATMQCPTANLQLVAIDGDGPEVSIDVSHLRQILWNLCENALKHGLRDRDDGIIELRHGRLRPSMRPFVEVADRGTGIEPAVAERIFEPFFSGGERGSGLGLFLARELAQTNAATLLYQPRPGGGSVFRLVFSDPRRWES
ncbi:MAG: PAS domain-containing sensor histidine kinase [Steroidobacteraceae bacterium]|nr:PAS domain-containing sensor histidine kinase [Nevskiaceae bacterium]MCP5359309.1 PAS domain-containing sensor histidine kinase [Nevskiaceae bacterium]MCP5471755.1 PAS domain-containing sensor histidine kinase [Nevskiaceae bacterium]